MGRTQGDDAAAEVGQHPEEQRVLEERAHLLPLLVVRQAAPRSDGRSGTRTGMLLTIIAVFGQLWFDVC